MDHNAEPVDVIEAPIFTSSYWTVADCLCNCQQGSRTCSNPLFVAAPSHSITSCHCFIKVFTRYYAMVCHLVLCHLHFAGGVTNTLFCTFQKEHFHISSWNLFFSIQGHWWMIILIEQWYYNCTPLAAFHMVRCWDEREKLFMKLYYVYTLAQHVVCNLFIIHAWY